MQRENLSSPLSSADDKMASYEADALNSSSFSDCSADVPPELTMKDYVAVNKIMVDGT